MPRVLVLTLAFSIAFLIAVPPMLCFQRGGYHDSGIRSIQSDVQAGSDTHATVPYRFRPEDARVLRDHYPNWDSLDLSRRANYVVGGKMPPDWRSRIQPVPIDAVRSLALPPSGYVFGYIDGYCVAYDPDTLVIADAIDLATFEVDKKRH